MATTPDVADRALTSPRRAKTVAAPVVHVVAGYAGLVTRAIAGAIDALLIDLAGLFVAAVVALVLSIFPITHNTKTVLAVIGGALFVVWAIAYFVTFWTTTGQTPGDRVMRIRVVRVDGGTLDAWRAALRLGVAVLGLVFLLGYVPILLNHRRRALHDWMAGTVVINEPASTKGTDT
jgi:uncharacterized RDD family membrane protein YckC